jgi:hypothetical protein
LIWANKFDSSGNENAFAVGSDLFGNIFFLRNEETYISITDF